MFAKCKGSMALDVLKGLRKRFQLAALQVMQSANSRAVTLPDVTVHWKTGTVVRRGEESPVNLFRMPH